MQIIKTRVNYRSARILLRELIITDFKLRYQGSVLGYAWSVLKPLFMFLILYLVFAVVLKVGDGVTNYPIYLLLGIMLWGFFAEMTQQGITSIVMRGDLIQKIRIPSWLIIVSASVGALINLALNFVVLLVFAFVYGMDFHFSAFFLPLFMVEIYLFALGVTLLLSALFVKYRDISYVWDLILQAGFYATPILYPVSLVTDSFLQKILLLNPMAQSIQGARNVLVTTDSITIGEVFGSRFAVLVPVFIVMLTLIIGFLYFRKEAKNFAENL